MSALVLAGVLVIVIVVTGFWFLSAPTLARPALAGTATPQTLLVDGRERSYTVFVPTALPEGAPLMLVLHGSQQTAAAVRAVTGYAFEQLAVRHGFVVAYPDGYRKGWNDGRRGSRTPARRAEIDDVALIDALVARLRSQYRLGPDAFLVGYSNGGQMVLRLLAEGREPLAGVAVIAANLPDVENRGYAPISRRVPALLIAGTADRTSPFLGGEVTLFGVSPRGRVISADATAAALAALHGATRDPDARTLPHRRDSGRTSVRELAYRVEGKPVVVQYVVENGGHVIPAATHRFPRIFGATTHDLDAPTAIWDFFRAQVGTPDER